MVIFDLICEHGHFFEGWFSSAEDFVNQKEREILNCPVCHSAHVEKKLSVPKLGRGKSNAESLASEATKDATQKSSKKLSAKEQKRQFAEFQEALRTVHDYIEKNFDDVGSKFTEQAVAMHTGDLPARNIRGTASAKQAKELRERGVSAVALPDKPVDKDKLN